jgi:hypothetical protein
MEKLISTQDAAELIRLKPQTLRSLRSKGGGPRFCKLSTNRVAYRPSDLETWIESRCRRSTADPGRAA